MVASSSGRLLRRANAPRPRPPRRAPLRSRPRRPGARRRRRPPARPRLPTRTVRITTRRAPSRPRIRARAPTRNFVEEASTKRVESRTRGGGEGSTARGRHGGGGGGGAEGVRAARARGRSRDHRRRRGSRQRRVERRPHPVMFFSARALHRLVSNRRDERRQRARVPRPLSRRVASRPASSRRRPCRRDRVIPPLRVPRRSLRVFPLFYAFLSALFAFAARREPGGDGATRRLSDVHGRSLFHGVATHRRGGVRIPGDERR